MSEDWQLLKAYLIQETGLAYYTEKDAELHLRLEPRLRHWQCGARDYLKILLETNHREWEQLLNLLTIGETYFFRYREQFDALQSHILPDLLKRQPTGRALRVWSAGCSSGEEAYSLSILLHENKLQNYVIMGSDLNPQALEQAKQARYRKWSFRQNPADFQTRYFDPIGQLWELRKTYRTEVTFKRHNLLSPYPLSQETFDLIFCRNVLIYFDTATQKRVIQNFYQQLSPNGWLVLGPSELSPLACYPFKSQALSHLSCYAKTPEYQAIEELISNAPLQAGSHSHQPVMEMPVYTPPQQPTRIALSSEKTCKYQECRQLADRGKWEEALLTAELALKLAPLDPQWHYELGLVLLGQMREDEAKQTWKRCIYLNRHHILAHYQLGRLHQKQGQIKQAQRYWQNALTLLSKQTPENTLPYEEDLNVAQLQRIVNQGIALYGS